MREKLSFIDRAVDRAGYWYAGWAMMSATLAWVWRQVPFLHDVGWALQFIIGLFSAAILMLLVTGALASWRYFRPLPQVSTWAEPESHSETTTTSAAALGPSERDDQALEELTIFALDHLLPSISALSTLQQTIIRKYAGHKIVAHFAIRGIRNNDHSVQSMYSAYDKISALMGSPQPHYSLKEMEEFVFCIEQNYRYFVSQLHQMAVELGIDHRKEHEFTPEWNAWREKHDAMSKTYDAIRRSKKFDKLYRPGLPNRFNQGVE